MLDNTWHLYGYIYPNLSMKAVYFPPFIWIWKVVMFLSNQMERAPLRVILFSFTVFGRLWWVWCWFTLVMLWRNSWHWERWIQVQFSFSESWDFWSNFKLLCAVESRIYPCTRYCISKIVMISSMYHWINVHGMNSYLDNVCIHEDDTNSRA